MKGLIAGFYLCTFILIIFVAITYATSYVFDIAWNTLDPPKTPCERVMDKKITDLTTNDKDLINYCKH